MEKGRKNKCHAILNHYKNVTKEMRGSISIPSALHEEILKCY